MMKYPVPQPGQQFSWLEEHGDFTAIPTPTWSRDQPPSQQMQEYISYIQKYQRLYKSIPFVEQIYLCNSITFNALKDTSDIDIVILAKPGCLRLARASSWIMFTLLGLKRFGKNTTKKFCLSYYIDREYCNLYKTSLQPFDVYLCHWIVHLVPLYSANTSYISKIYTDNHRVAHYLPNIEIGQNIGLGIPVYVGESRFKRIVEQAITRLPGLKRTCIAIIKGIRMPILHRKVKTLGQKGRGIIISDTALKFYQDRRKWINYQFKQIAKPFHKKDFAQEEPLF